MSLPSFTSTILIAAGYEDSQFRSSYVDGTIVLDWHGVPTPPTAQQIIDWGADTTPLPNTQLFSAWLEEHGGNAAKTLRRKAKEALDDQAQEQFALTRALAIVIMKEINLLRAEHSLAPRTLNQLRNAIKTEITNGEADS